jgi:P27 family predicted phage terminase small subunit
MGFLFAHLTIDKMGLRGPKPKPSALEQLQGYPGHRPANDAEPQPPDGAPDMPEHLSDVAKQEWNWLVEMLAQMNILKQSDRAIMTLYCDTWAEYIEVRHNVEKYGMVIPNKDKTTIYQSPYINVESMLKKQLESYLAGLGLSPSSRTRIRTNGTEEESDPITDRLKNHYDNCN